MGWEGIGTLFGKIAEQFQGRIERTKNEIDKLEKEKTNLLISKADVTRAKRLAYIEQRLPILYGLLKNKAT